MRNGGAAARRGVARWRPVGVPHGRRGLRVTLAAGLWAVIALLTTLTACRGGEPPPGTVDRDTFLDAWIALRIAAAEASDGDLDGPERDRILAEHGMDEQDLVDFVQAHGADIGYMNELWSDALERLEEEGVDVPSDEGPGMPSPRPDTAG